MGFHHSIQVNEITLPPKVLLYKEYTGDYRKIGEAFTTLDKELSQFDVKSYQSFGLYYDNPNLLADFSQSRAIIGILLDPSNRTNAVKFMVDHPNYRVNEYGDINGISAKFLYRNDLSFGWIISRVYPALTKYAQDKKLFSSQASIGAFEIYHYKNGEPVVEVIFPYGPGLERLILNKSPVPNYQKETIEL